MKLEISDWVLALGTLAALTYYFGGRLWLWWKDGGFVVDGQKKKPRVRRARSKPRDVPQSIEASSHVPRVNETPPCTSDTPPPNVPVQRPFP